jgi:hypothetical protein
MGSCSIGKDWEAPWRHFDEVWSGLPVLRLEALMRIEGHLRTRRDTCNPEGREQGHMAAVVQVVIMEQNDDLAVGMFSLEVKYCRVSFRAFGSWKPRYHISCRCP